MVKPLATRSSGQAPELLKTKEQSVVKPLTTRPSGRAPELLETGSSQW